MHDILSSICSRISCISCVSCTVHCASCIRACTKLAKCINVDHWERSTLMKGNSVQSLRPLAIHLTHLRDHSSIRDLRTRTLWYLNKFFVPWYYSFDFVQNWGDQSSISEMGQTFRNPVSSFPTTLVMISQIIHCWVLPIMSHTVSKKMQITRRHLQFLALCKIVKIILAVTC